MEKVLPYNLNFRRTSSTMRSCVCPGVPRASTTAIRARSRAAIARYAFRTRPKNARLSCSNRFSSFSAPFSERVTLCFRLRRRARSTLKATSLSSKKVTFDDVKTVFRRLRAMAATLDARYPAIDDVLLDMIRVYFLRLVRFETNVRLHTDAMTAPAIAVQFCDTITNVRVR